MERKLACAQMASLLRVPINDVRLSQKMVFAGLKNSARFEELPGGVPQIAKDYYTQEAKRCSRESMPLLLKLLQSTPMCCAPAAIIYQHLCGGELVVGRLGFSDDDWEYGESGVKWV